jgi:lipopolysaccharide transport system ATP-binding protein
MSDTVIKIENVSKIYRLGEVGTGSLAHDINRWWHKIRGKENPYLKFGDVNDRASATGGDYAWALKDISFEVKRGEVLGIIGRNGAGKSTLLKILSRVTQQTEGRIKVRGRIASLLEVGTGFHPELTGRENIFLNGAILGMRKAEIARKFDEIVEFSGCARYIDTPVKRYSSGMYVRLAFAVAAHLEPEILIVDEVLAVGDAEFQKKCLGKMKDVAGHGRTILFVSHNMAAVDTLCSRAVCLNSGRNDFDGSTSEAINHYLGSGLLEQNQAQVSLEKHPNRLGGMKRYLKEIGINTFDRKPCQSFRHGDKFRIVVSYDASRDFDKIAGCGLILRTINGVQVAGVNTYMLTPPPHKLPAKGKIEFIVNGPAFNPGSYLLTVSIGDHQTKLIDKVEDCLGFEIREHDYYGTGYIVTSQDGVVAFECALS